MQEAGSCEPFAFSVAFSDLAVPHERMSCLQKVTQTQPHCQRAEICGVCTTPFSILPPPVPEATFIRMLPWWRYGYGSEIAQYAPGVA